MGAPVTTTQPPPSEEEGEATTAATAAAPAPLVPLFGGALAARVPPRLADVSLARPVPDHQEVFSDPSLDQALIFEVLEQQEEAGVAVVVEDGRGAAEFFFGDLMEQSEAAEARLDKVDELKGRGTATETTSSSSSSSSVVLAGLAASPPPPNPSDPAAAAAARSALDACSYAALATGTASISKGGGGSGGGGAGGERSSSTTTTPSSQQRQQQPLNAVAVALAVLRFPAVRSDVLVSLTSATSIAPGSSSEARAARNVAAAASASGVGGAEGIAAAAEELLRSVVASFEVRDWGLFG